MNVALRPPVIPAREWRSISVCAGVGGLDIGIDLVEPGHRTVCYVEREASAAASLVASMEGGWFHPAPVWSDLGTFDGRPWRGRVHLVTSGDPCQPNSVAGRGLGEADDRFLIDQLVRVVAECRPRRVFRENVTGNADGQLLCLVPALEALGYRVASGIFSAAGVGASHERERLFVMADFAGEPGRLHAGQRRSGEGAADAGRGGVRMDDAERAERRPVSSARGDQGPDGLQRHGQEGAGWAGASGEGLADADSARRSPTGSGHPLDAGRQPQPGCGDMEHAPRLGRGEGRPEPELRRGRGTAAVSGGELADADGIGRRAKGDAGVAPADALQRSDWLPPFAPGPSDPRWPAIIAGAPELEPAVRRMADGLANRIERLRACGNGVVPLAAADAWLALDARLGGNAAARFAAVMERDK